MEKLNLEETLRSMNGFEEISVRKMFRCGISELDGTSAARAAIFVVTRRDGMGERDAFNFAMNLTIGGLEDRIAGGGAQEDPDEEGLGKD